MLAEKGSPEQLLGFTFHVFRVGRSTDYSTYTRPSKCIHPKPQFFLSHQILQFFEDLLPSSERTGEQQEKLAALNVAVGYITTLTEELDRLLESLRFIRDESEMTEKSETVRRFTYTSL